MAIHWTRGNLFDAPATMLVCPVNCVGAMGKGLALEFARRFGGDFEASYKGYCAARHLRPGRVVMASGTGSDGATKCVVLFPTKDHWRNPSRPIYVFSGLVSLALSLDGLTAFGPVAIPALGCGLGGLSWGDIRPMIEVFCGLFPEREFYVYPPGGEESTS